VWLMTQAFGSLWQLLIQNFAYLLEKSFLNK